MIENVVYPSWDLCPNFYVIFLFSLGENSLLNTAVLCRMQFWCAVYYYFFKMSALFWFKCLVCLSVRSPFHLQNQSKCNETNRHRNKLSIDIDINQEKKIFSIKKWDISKKRSNSAPRSKKKRVQMASTMRHSRLEKEKKNEKYVYKLTTYFQQTYIIMSLTTKTCQN